MALVLREVSAVLCSREGVRYVIDGSEQTLHHRGAALLVRGRVFRGDEVLPWELVAKQLDALSELCDLRSYVSRLSGSFWLVYRVKQMSFLATDPVGVMPMWLSHGADHLVASVHPSCHFSSQLHQSCPRLQHCWDGRLLSEPVAFYGLHGPDSDLLMPESLREAFSTALKRCVQGEQRVGLWPGPAHS